MNREMGMKIQKMMQGRNKKEITKKIRHKRKGK
jgi:hypothetical protein